MKEKKFTLIATEKDGQGLITSENKGFNALEILGILRAKEADILDQMNHPQDFKRYSVDKKGNRCENVKEGEK